MVRFRVRIIIRIRFMVKVRVRVSNKQNGIRQNSAFLSSQIVTVLRHLVECCGEIFGSWVF